MNNTQQQDLMCNFILQETHACKDVDPERVTVFGPVKPDWFHPPLNQIGGLCISCCEGKKTTILVCKPMPDYEPTVIQVWEDDNFSERKAVYFCPNAVIVMRPTEEGDETLLESDVQEEVTL